MFGTATLRRGIAAFCLAVIVAAPLAGHVAYAENKTPPSQSHSKKKSQKQVKSQSKPASKAQVQSQPRPVSTQMPGGKFRRRNVISLAAHQALTILSRTENIEDPGYVSARRKTSDLVAQELKLDAERLNAAWAKVPRDHQIAILAAITQLNVKYIEGKEDPYVAMDCSGLMWYAWRVAGVDEPRESVSQLDKRMRVKRKDAIAGDIVGEGTHVHLYLGIDLAMIHAPFNGKKVKFKIMSEEQAARVAWTDPTHIATYRL